MVLLLILSRNQTRTVRKTCTKPGTLCCITCPDNWETRRKNGLSEWHSPNHPQPYVSHHFKCIYAGALQFLTLYPCYWNRWPTCTKSRCNQDCKAGGNRGPLPETQWRSYDWKYVQVLTSYTERGIALNMFHNSIYMYSITSRYEIPLFAKKGRGTFLQHQGFC